MKLRVRINRQTCRVDIEGEEPNIDPETHLSLNSSELLSDTGQTLSSCGIVSGDLICVILPESAAAAAAAAAAATSVDRSHVQDSEGSREQRVSVSYENIVGQDVAKQTLQEIVVLPALRPDLLTEKEGQAPLSLELLYHSAQTASPSDAIMVAGNLLMLETGFIPQGGELKPAEMPDGWRSVGGVFKLQYSHPLCENSLAMVVAVCMGPVLVINATLKVNETVDTVRKLCLNPSSYVTDEWPGRALIGRCDLSKLSRVFKDQLAYPLIAAAREAMALPVAFGLAALPPELLLRVLRLLDVRSVVRLSSVCRHFNGATADSTLWRHLYRRDFTDPDPSRSRDTDWKELYKRYHKLRCEHRHIARHRSLPPFHRNPWDIFGSGPAPLHPPLPGIIGGEYDQRPHLPRGHLPPHPRYEPLGPLFNGRPLNDLRRARAMGRPADVRRGFI
uniref:F-box protein 7 n=1 Tax=Seriola lalandi dorsalis TaxID=1841481 RepID=A0A3B4YQF5_SERLL